MVLICFGRPPLGHIIKTNYIVFRNVDLRGFAQFWIFIRVCEKTLDILKTLGNMCILIIAFPVCEVINFETDFSFLIKPLSYMTKKGETKI